MKSQNKIASPVRAWADRCKPRLGFVPLASLLFACGLLTIRSAVVTGNLVDINLGPLTTKLTFTPTNEVLVTAAGLSAGPALTIDTSNGLFVITLDAGDYTCALPLISWRKPFVISVPPTTNICNITNLLAAPKGYVYTGDTLLADDGSDNGVTLLSDP